MKQNVLQKLIRSFTKKKFWTTTMAMLLFFMLFGTFNVHAQIAFNVTGNTNTTPNLATSYPSFAATLTALNAVTAITGNVEINATLAGLTETAPPKGFTIGSTTLNAATENTSFYIYFNGGANTIYAGIGTSAVASTNPDGMLKLVGADHITINNFTFVDNNTSGNAMMEFGIGLFKASATDGCNFNEIMTNYITMQRANTFATAGPITGGATSILMSNSTHAAAGTSLSPTSVSGANSSNLFNYNITTGGLNGIVLSGFNGVTPFPFADYNNKVENNGIYNFGTAVALPVNNAHGIFTTSQFNIIIELNAVDNNDGTGVNHVHNFYGINATGANATNPIIRNNDIKMQSGTAANILMGVQNSSGTASSVVINENKIKFGYPNGTTPAATAVRGISNASLPTTLEINNNTIEGIAGSPIGGTGETNFIINNNVTATATVTTNNNIIRDFQRLGESGTIYGIRIFANNWTASGNVIGSLKWSSTTATGNINPIQNHGLSTANTYTNNTIINCAVSTTGQITGITDLFAGTKTVQGNNISAFSKTALTTVGGSLRGMVISGTVNNISNNTIFNFAGNADTVQGIAGTSNAGGSTTLNANKIFDLSSSLTNAISVTGIYQLGDAPATISNNIIGGLTAPNLNSIDVVVNGIALANLTPAFVYFNTVLLSGTSSGLNFSSSAFSIGTAPNVVLRNNIFINNMVPKGTGRATAYFRNSTTLTSYDASSNNNLLAGTSLFFDGTNNINTLAAYKTFMATRDQNSVTETLTPFASTLGSSADFLRLANGVISVANNNALPVTSPAITTDYFGTTRSTTTPDIGASEFNGLVCVAPTVFAVNGGGTGCANLGVAVGLANSQINVNYQLKLNGVAAGAVVAGTGAALSFGAQMISGNYTVDAVSNVVGCPTPVTMSGSVIVNISALSVGGSISGTKTICNGQSSGTLTLSGNTGTIVRWEQAFSPFTSWNALTNTTDNFTSGALIQTTHFRAVSKSGACPEVTSAPAIITVNTINASPNTTPVSCNGGTNGSASLSSISGGAAPYTYLWSNGGTNATITGLSVGTYSCTVTDNAGCSRLFSGLVITQPAVISLAVGSQSNVSCFGGSNGFASVSPSGGIAPYTYSWTSGGNTASKTGVTAGSYTVTVTDANSCQATRTFIITQPVVLSGTRTVTPVTCNGGSNGAINLTPTGGVGPYTFNWGGGILSEDRTSLATGTYSVTITDANGCTASVTGITVTQPATALAATLVSKTNILCFGGNNGSATISVSGGTPGYSYNWTPGNPPGDGTPTISGITAAAWSCTVTDNFGCTTTINVPITQPWGIDAIASTQTNVSCLGGNNGRALVSVANGTPPYTYDWTPGNPVGEGTGDARSLTAGNYNCLVTDANGCTRNVGFTITEPASAISSTITSVTNTTCGANSGAATATATGGTPPYNYDWAPGIPTGDGTANVTGLSAGNYSCTVIDSKGCTSIQNFSISSLSTTWSNGSWSNGLPDSSKIAIFESNYVSAINLIACSVVVSGTASVVFPSASNMTITNAITVATAATLVFESDSNLIQINAATNTSNIVYKRNAQMNRLDYVFWSSPVANQNLLTFTPNTFANRFYTFSEPTRTYLQVASPSTTNFEVAKGYSLRAPNDFVQAPAPAQTFNGVYSGVPNNGNYTIPVTFTTGQGNGFNLIGNPYPSNVSGQAFLTANTGSIYFWTHQSYYVGNVLTNGGIANYATLNLSGAVAATVNLGTNVMPNGFIQAGQGFMFLTTTDKNVTFTNAMRATNNEGQFFRTAQNTSQNKLWLNLTNNGGAFSQTMIAYLPNTTTGFDDGYDARQINETGNVLSSKIANDNYAIQSRGNFEISDVVKLNLNIATAGSYTLSKDNTNGIFSSNQDFFLRDNLLGTTHNIKQSPYNFVAQAGNLANRFEIVYHSALSNNNNIFDNANVIVFEQNGLLNVSATDDLKSVKIFDIQGRNIFEMSNINAKTADLNTFRAQQQVLMVQITNANNELVTKKVIF